mmetsp:Transcript_100496/g.283435  ORF Transcript_100496/g.283435 Transcript_100496/m.283435 type:complete len:237 (-) Transcript_100496:1726-2436(-)
MVAAALEPRSELPGRHKEVHVVAADEILCHRNDGARQGRLPVVVRAVLADVADQLRDLHVTPHVALERAIEHLALCRLEAVHNGRHTAHDAVLRELHKLKLDEVLVRQRGLRMIHARAILVAVHPSLAVVGPRFAESHVDKLAVLVRLPLEVQAVFVHCREILLGLCGSAGPQTLVVLDLPSLAVVVLTAPSFVLGLREERVHLAGFGGLHDRSDEFLHEATILQQVRPPEVEEVD